MSLAAPSEFIPFRPAPPSHVKPDPISLQILQTPPARPAFTPLTFPHNPACSDSPSPKVSPTVTLRRDGDRVTGIRIECSCGQVLDLACEF
jgi:hypothetical protein